MAKLFITELYGVGVPEVAQLPPIAEQVLTFTTSTQSSALNAQTTIVRLYSDTACHIAVGSNPTATTSNMKLAADSPEYFIIRNGVKIAAVTA